MSVICACGKPATHRVRWNEWLDVSEPVPSKHPSRCLTCAIAQSREDTIRQRERREYEHGFDDLSRDVFCTVTPVPHEWVKLARQAARRHGEAINPGGLVRVFQQHCHLYVELYPPKERPETWRSENCLYVLRYLTRRPMVFRQVRRGESPSPATRRESAKQWSDTEAGPLLMTPSATSASEDA